MIKAAVKTLNLAFLAGIFFVSPVAEATYLGTINRQDGYTFEVVTSASVIWSVTFLSVDRGRLEVDNMIAGNGNLPPFTVSLSRSAARGILELDVRGGSALFRVNDGGNVTEVLVETDSSNRAVFDLIN